MHLLMSSSVAIGSPFLRAIAALAAGAAEAMEHAAVATPALRNARLLIFTGVIYPPS